MLKYSVFILYALFLLILLGFYYHWFIYYDGIVHVDRRELEFIATNLPNVVMALRLLGTCVELLHLQVLFLKAFRLLVEDNNARSCWHVAVSQIVAQLR